MYDLIRFNPLWKVIDPSCGEGVFMLKALERKCATVAGVDIDPMAIEKARENLAVYSGKIQLFCQDGLKKIETNNGFWAKHYDLVIGNPPFSASKYRVRDKKILSDFELAWVDKTDPSVTGSLFGEKLRLQRRKSSQVIEALFLERFTKLAKPGGKVIIILPEGIFANSNLRHVREWLLRNFILHAVIGLPRDVFKHTGTTAKTAILYLENHKPNPNHKTFLAEVSEVKLDANNNSQLEAVLKAFRCRSKS